MRRQAQYDEGKSMLSLLGYTTNLSDTRSSSSRSRSGNLLRMPFRESLYSHRTAGQERESIANPNPNDEREGRERGKGGKGEGGRWRVGVLSSSYLHTCRRYFCYCCATVVL